MSENVQRLKQKLSQYLTSNGLGGAIIPASGSMDRVEIHRERESLGLLTEFENDAYYQEDLNPPSQSFQEIKARIPRIVHLADQDFGLEMRFVSTVDTVEGENQTTDRVIFYLVKDGYPYAKLSGNIIKKSNGTLIYDSNHIKNMSHGTERYVPEIIRNYLLYTLKSGLFKRWSSANMHQSKGGKFYRRLVEEQNELGIKVDAPANGADGVYTIELQ